MRGGDHRAQSLTKCTKCPTFDNQLIPKKNTGSNKMRDSRQKGKECEQHGSALLGVKPKNHKGMATHPGIPARHMPKDALYGAQSWVR